MARKNSAESKSGLSSSQPLATNRQQEIASWLAGEGPRTDEETALAAKFGGPNANEYARQAISARRQAQAQSSLNGAGELTSSEQQLVYQFGGKSADKISRLAVSQKRRTGLLKYISGDKDANITG